MLVPVAAYGVHKDGWRDKRGWELEGVNAAIVCKDMVTRNLVIDLDQIPVKHRDASEKAKHITAVMRRYVAHCVGCY